MSSTQTRQDRNLVLQRQHQEQARNLLAAVGTDFSSISVGDAQHELVSVPTELAAVIHEVVAAMASGSPLSIARLPEELTTTVAAEQLGMSRPTLMQLIKAGEIDAHKVGSHHRLKSSDVVEFKRRRLQRQRDAFARLRTLDEDLDQF